MTIEERWQKYRKGLNAIFLPKYDCFEDLVKPLGFAPYSGYRSFAEQDLLYAQGRSFGNKTVTNARAGTSPHQWGAAIDCACFDGRKDIFNADWDTYGAMAAKANLVWGGDFKMVDKPHVELLINVPWSHVLRAFNMDPAGIDLFIKSVSI